MRLSDHRPWEAQHRLTHTTLSTLFVQAKQKGATTPVGTPMGELDAGVNPFFPQQGPASTARAQQAVPPAPAHENAPPAHAERDLPEVITAEGAGIVSSSSRQTPGARGLPSEMSHPYKSPTNSGNTTPTNAADSAKPTRPIFRTGKSSGSGPGGRLPAGNGPSQLPRATTPFASALGSMTTTSHTQPRPAAPPVDTTTPAHTRQSSSITSPTQPHPSSFPPPSPSAQQQPSSASLSRSASRSASRRRSSTHSAPQFAAVQESMPHPFHLSHNPQGNIGLQNALEAVKGETEGMVWIGALGNRTDGITPGVRTEIEERLWKEQNSKAVWLEDAVFEGHCQSISLAAAVCYPSAR